MKELKLTRLLERFADDEPEKTKDEKPAESSKYDRIHTKSLRQLATENAAKERDEKRKKLIVEEVPEKPKEEKPGEEKEEKPVEPPKEEPKVDVDAVAKKAAEETATKVAAETKEAFKSEIDKILNKDKDMVEKQKDADALIAAWDKEGRLPKNYKELIDETQRIADEKMNQRFKAEQTERERVKKETEEKETANKAELEKKQGGEKFQEFNKQIAQDLNDLYDAKLLPRPDKFEEVNNEQTKDSAALETQKVLKFGVELNTRLVREGKTPVTSLAKIYFLHYKPYMDANPAPKTDQPAGADAPISGNRSTPTGSESKVTDYKTLHNETWAQTKMRLAREAVQKALNK